MVGTKSSIRVKEVIDKMYAMVGMILVILALVIMVVLAAVVLVADIILQIGMLLLPFAVIGLTIYLIIKIIKFLFK